MAESEKRGLFGRLFGGGRKDQPSDAEPRPDDQTPEGASSADVGQAAKPVAPEKAREGEETIDTPVIMPVELAPVLPVEPAPVGEEAADQAEAPIKVNAEPEPEPEPEAGAPPVFEPAAAERAEAEGPVEGTGELAAPKSSWFQRLREGLSRSSSALGDGITSVFRKRRLDADTLEELEDLLIQADLGADTAMTITERLAEARFDKEISEDEVRAVLADEIEKVLEPVALPLDLETGLKPHVVLVVGVNGTGKTTTIGKLAAKLTREGKKVMLAAGDTFRAAAVEQLKIWGERTGSTVVARDTGADAAGLVFDAMKQAREEGCDVLLIDTAGRLQNRAELMAELEKVVRVIKKQVPEAPHTVLLTLDATTGQNALQQVEIFRKTAGVTGLVMTKLDGTARGGILVAISAKHALPVHFIGIGEGVDDLEPFAARDFAAAIAGTAK